MAKKRKTPVEKLSDPEREKIAQFFVDNSGFLYFTAYLYVDHPNDAEDLIQDCMLHLMKHAELFLSLSAKRQSVYCAKTITNLYIDAYRRKNLISVQPFSDDYESPPQSMELVPGSDTHLSMLELALQLPEKEWAVLKKLYLEGLPKQLVAKELGYTQDSLRAMASRARASARKVLDQKRKGDEANG